ncbi:MAG: phosphate-binding protein, partial [Methylobacter sp.]|nr:phosphate-binding protein [Methylobacter sp.]
MKLSFKTKSLATAMGLALAALTSVNANAAQQTVDPGLPEYQKASGISGNLSSVGSDTLANLMTLWAEEFNREYPNVNIQIQAAGSSTA